MKIILTIKGMENEEDASEVVLRLLRVSSFKHIETDLENQTVSLESQKEITDSVFIAALGDSKYTFVEQRGA